MCVTMATGLLLMETTSKR